MPFFIDTSALFKRYQPEKGTATVTRILEDHSEPLYISSITIVEMISNLKRLFEVDRITTEDQLSHAAKSSVTLRPRRASSETSISRLNLSHFPRIRSDTRD